MTGPFVLAAGGTGGHMVPAHVLALELKRRGHDVAQVAPFLAGYESAAFQLAHVEQVADVAVQPFSLFADRDQQVVGHAR